MIVAPILGSTARHAFVRSVLYGLFSFRIKFIEGASAVFRHGKEGLIDRRVCRKEPKT